MSRYFFRISNGRPHEDDVGEELRDEREAWLSAKRLVRDIEDSLEPDGKWVVEVRDAAGPLYLISIDGRKLR
ncbi:DUF6894 family protein [Bradyrhizobium sp.]|uniref:DUF6894 family protein n=1 Tax=Bradyrhizobium sp. TaxID=376 RepID=UPI0023970C41|nr:hypothetical protein [Bradyrhizobium sp.]MDE1936675.1 hypothetical protein [Bradyrhizobium sp.]MDE2063346.1 hypothetical protein [Bradyrhizobium sp.]